MRILELILAPMLGGAETLVSGLATEWRASGHHVDIVALDPAPDNESRRSASVLFGDRLTEPIPLSLPKNLQAPRQIQRVVRLTQYLRSQPKYDVIHTHSLLPNLYGRMVSLWSAPGTIRVETVHSVDLSKEYRARSVRCLEKILLCKTDAVVAVSDQGAEEFKQLFPTFGGRVHVIPNGIPFTPVPKQDYSSTPTKFVATSRIVRVKNLDMMIKSFDRFATQAPFSVSLDIVGPFVDPDYKSELEDRISRAKNPSAFRLLGAHHDIPSLLASSDVLVHLSLRESHPLSVIEAAASGLPIVASNLPAIRNSVGEAAILVDPEDEDAIVEALMQIARHWANRVEASGRFAQRACEKFSISECANRYLAVFRG